MISAASAAVSKSTPHAGIELALVDLGRVLEPGAPNFLVCLVLSLSGIHASARQDVAALGAILSQTAYAVGLRLDN
jgi:hypothetical protein